MGDESAQYKKNPPGRPRKILKKLKILLQAIVVTLCLLYALRGVEIGVLLEALSGYSAGSVSVTLLLFALCLWIQAVRLSVLFEPSLGPFGAFKAVIVGLGLNNVLPAKGGEAAKVIYIGKFLGRPVSEATGAVFFERFFDINCLYLLSALILGDIISPMLLRRMGAFFLACWAIFAIFRFRPDLFDRIWRALPWLRGVKFLDDLQRRLLRDLAAPRLAAAGALTAGVWVTYCLYSVYTFMYVGSLSLTPVNAATVFLISAAGQLIPSSPGSLGVFEASVVWGFGLFGIDREPALGMAFLLRAIQLL
ncbi:MAG: flippase-like domain-containing protein, partial [Synergistaceae bacterium]|nr:flippase-like domain-containing protein [Synergistaceae bacterium]